MGFRQRPSWHADAVRGAVHPIIPGLACRAWKRCPYPLLLSALRFAPESRNTSTRRVDRAEYALGVGHSLLRRFTEPSKRTKKIWRDTPTFCVRDPQAVLSEGVSLGGGLAVPVERLLVVLRYSSTHLVHLGEFELPIRKPSIGRLLKPEDCLTIVLWDADAAIIATANRNLRVGIILGCCFVIPFEGELEVLGDATAEFVQQAEHALGVGMSLPSGGSKNTFRYLIIHFRRRRTGRQGTSS